LLKALHCCRSFGKLYYSFLFILIRLEFFFSAIYFYFYTHSTFWSIRGKWNMSGILRLLWLQRGCHTPSFHWRRVVSIYMYSSFPNAKPPVTRLFARANVIRHPPPRKFSRTAQKGVY
jgi:hypothetical protein